MQEDDIRRDPTEPAAPELADRALWQFSRMIDASPDDAGRILDLAGFADRCLDPDDEERVAEWLAGDPIASGDVAAARALGARAEPLEPAPDPVVARARALVERIKERSTVVPFPVVPFPVVPFPAGRRDRPTLHRMASWGSLAAAMAVASWLGFTLGMDTSLSLSQAGAQRGQGGEDGFLREMLDPSTGFIRDLTEGNRT